MPLTQAQKATLKAYIQADPVLGPKAIALDYDAIANALNAQAPGPVKAWLTSVTPEMMDDAPDYTAFDAISAGKRDSWAFLIARNRDFTRNKTRKWITDIWGNATAGSNAEAILLTGTVNCTLAESVIGGPTKTTNNVSAIDRGFIGTISVFDIGPILA
jgi:hypothetical protein